MKQPKNKSVSSRTDKETFNFFKKIADSEEITFSLVIHLALKKVMANFKPEEITKPD